MYKLIDFNNEFHINVCSISYSFLFSVQEKNSVYRDIIVKRIENAVRIT